MSIKWIKTAHKGLRYYEHPVRKHGKQRDRNYSIYFRVGKKLFNYGVGWLSDGIPDAILKEESELGFQDYCLKLLRQYKGNAKSGAGPKSPKEQREIAADKDAQKQQEQERNQKDTLTFKQIFGKVGEEGKEGEGYIGVAEANKTKRSWKTEESLFNLWIEPTIGNLPLKDIAPIHLERIKKNMVVAGRAPRSIAYALSLIRQVYNYSRRNHLYAGEWPGHDGAVKIPREDNRRKEHFTHENADKLMAALKEKSPILHDMALLSLHSGLRAGETFKLTWADVDLGRGTMFIRDPKNKHNRYAYSTEAVKAMLTTRKAEWDAAAKKASEKGEKISALVFPSRKSEQAERISKTFSRVVDDLKLNEGRTDPRYRFVYHSLRHTYASWLAQDGVSLFTIKELLGHSQISMTERYSHLQPVTFQNAVKILEQGVATARQKEAERLQSEQEQTDEVAAG